MKTIGLIGGMSWHSTVEYYRLINQDVHRRFGGHHSAKILLSSLDFAEIRAMQQSGSWDLAGETLAGAGRGLEQAGADMLLICTNLMHKVAEDVEHATTVPLLHIADAAGAAAAERGFSRLGVLATRWVMEEDFYRSRLARHGVDTVVAGAADREMVDRVIFDELTQGVVREPSKAAYVATIERLAEAGAEAVLLGCTEIQLLVSPDDSPLPLIDSTAVHAARAVELAVDPVPAVHATA
jgi:aspartate racemase